MAFTVPDLATLRTQSRAAFVARLPTLDGQLRRSIVNTIADVVAGMVWLCFRYLVWMSNQLLPDTAETTYLDRWLAIKNITRIAAVDAQLSVSFPGTNGRVLPATTPVVIGNHSYTVDADGTVSGGFVVASITATPGQGDLGNADNGSIVNLTTAIAGINASGTVVATLVAGADQESDDSVRVRLLLALQQPAAGGNQADYEEWALQVSGVTRAWVIPLAGGAGTVTVIFATDNASYGPIPHSGDVTALQSYLNSKAPVTAVVTAAAPTANTVNFTIASLTPSNTTTKAAIRAALVDLFRQAGGPSGTIQLQAISDAITRAGGITGFDLTAPSADVTTGSGAIPVVGTITWT